MRQDQLTEIDGWFTLPNLVTVARLALVLPIVVLLIRGDRPWLTLGLLVIFGASDWIDGFLARRLGQASKVGAVLDPVADRIGVVAVIAGFILAGMLTAWMVLVIVVVDIAVAVSVAVGRFRPPRVSVIGKVRTALLMIGMALLGVGLLPGYADFVLAGQLAATFGVILHVFAGIGYVRDALAGRNAQGRDR